MNPSNRCCCALSQPQCCCEAGLRCANLRSSSNGFSVHIQQVAEHQGFQVLRLIAQLSTDALQLLVGAELSKSTSVEPVSHLDAAASSRSPTGVTMVLPAAAVGPLHCWLQAVLQHACWHTDPHGSSCCCCCCRALRHPCCCCCLRPCQLLLQVQQDHRPSWAKIWGCQAGDLARNIPPDMDPDRPQGSLTVLAGWMLKQHLKRRSWGHG
jgi:hypothetical protein